MSSQAWAAISNAASVESLCLAAFTGVSTHVYHRRTTPESELEWCKKELHDIKTRINELSPDRRERLFIAAKEGKCTSLDALEHELQSLLDLRCALAQRTEQSSFWQRNLPAKFKLSQLRSDIVILKDAVMVLRADTWTSTTIHLKEDEARARVLSMTADAHTHTRAQPSTSGNSHGIHVSGQPEEHPLNIMPPPPAHITGRCRTAEVPLGIA